MADPVCARVLLVDDDPLIIRGFSRVLRERYQVTALSDGRDAVALIGKGARFDAILCDLMMPEFTGMDLFTNLMAMCPDEARRVVFLTGGATTESAQTFLDEAPNQPLHKPFRAEDLLDAVEKVRGACGSAI